MSKFTPAMLIPASQVAAFSKPAGQRTLQQVALDNINKMKEQFAAGDAAEGKVHFKLAGDRISFTIRVNNSAIVLERVTVQDTEVEVKEMTAPKANFNDALDFYADRIKAGEYDAQLQAAEERRSARTAKAQSTRAEKKASKDAAKGSDKAEAAKGEEKKPESKA